MAKKRILLVDDEASLTKMIKLNLEATGKYEVETENQGTNALKTAKVFKPDFIFLDIIMPDMTGSEVARQMKADEVLKNIPIVFLTATITQEEMGQSNEKGEQFFLAKPVRVQQIIGCIEKYNKE